MKKAMEEFELGIDALISEIEFTSEKTREILDRLPIDDVVAHPLSQGRHNKREEGHQND